MGNAQAIGHDGCRCGSTATGARRLADNLVDYQKIMGVTFIPDDAQLAFDPIGHDRCQGAVPPSGPVVGLLA